MWAGSQASRRVGAHDVSRGGILRRISILGRILGGAGSDQQCSQQQQRASPAASVRDLGNNIVHFCGGCGAAFLVDGGVAVFPVDMDGTAREFCACCHEFLGDRLPARSMARAPGYDGEGQELNARFPDLTPTGKRYHRHRETQLRLDEILRTYSSRSGVRPPTPLFVSG
jgi:hypothetical protein